MGIDTGPDHPFQHLTRNVNKVIEQMQRGYYNFRPGDTWAPNVNLYESEGCYLVCVDLAGVDKTKLDLQVLNGRLVIRGNRNVPTYETCPASDPTETAAPSSDDGQDIDVPLNSTTDRSSGRLRVHVMEIDHGPFHREVELPEDVEQDRIAAHYINGLLWIEIPKA